MKLFLKILLSITILAGLLYLLTIFFAEPWIEKKILSVLNENDKGYVVNAEKVHLSLFPTGIELSNITISSGPDRGAIMNLKWEIASIRLVGINLMKILKKKDIYIRQISISGSSVDGTIPTLQEETPPVIADFNLIVKTILFDKFDVSLTYDSTARGYLIRKGILKLVNLHIKKHDTLTPAIVRQFNFKAEEFNAVSSDSMYSYYASGLFYSDTTNSLVADSFSIQPNYPDYEFTARHEFQTDRIEAGFNGIYIHGFSASNYYLSGNLEGSYIIVEKMEMNVFRDKRKKFRHVNRPPFQDVINNYPGKIRIDSLRLISGNITYTEHAEQASSPGRITFTGVSAQSYKITNDTLYKKTEGYTKLDAEALLMGKSKLSISLKARIFDSTNTFSLDGTLSDLEADELNPMLEHSAFIYATSGRIDGLKFRFTANNTKATGKMTLQYHGLDIAIKNKRTDDTTAFVERIASIIAKSKMFNANPMPGQTVRVGIIDNERDPEKFLFSYCFKSILSGLKYTIARKPEKKKNP